MLNTEKDTFANFSEVDFYTLFICLLEKPRTDRETVLLDRRLIDVLNVVAAYLGVEKFRGIEPAESVQDAQSLYLSLFEVGVPAPPCPLNESHYNRKEPPTKIIHENLLFYRAFGLDPAVENSELADHILNQLEFLSCLTRLEEQSVDEGAVEAVRLAKRDFITRHVISWIPEVRRRLENLGDRVYTPVFILLEEYLKADLARLPDADAPYERIRHAGKNIID